MAASSGAESEGKKLVTELRVIDLRAELEKRGLDKTGVKAQLIERLEMALLTENHDPAEYLFDVPESRKVAKRPRTGGKGEGESSETTDGEQEELEEEQMQTDDTVVAEGYEADAAAGETVKEDVSFDMDLKVDEDSTPTDQEVQLSAAEEEIVEGAGDDIKVPPPDQVEPQCPFTVEDTIQLHQATLSDKGKLFGGNGLVCSDSVSMIVHPEEETVCEQLPAGGNDITEVDVSAVLSSESSPTTADGEEKRSVGGGNSATHSEEVMQEAVDEPPCVTLSESTTETESKSDTELKVSSSPSTENKVDDNGTTKMINGMVQEQESGGKGAQDPSITATTTTTENQSEARTVATVEKSEKKSTKAGGSSTSGKNLWISNLSQSTRATDLKALFSKYGRVTAAKIVTSKGQGSSGSKYFGMVTMSTADEAAKCVTNLHRTELRGKMIEIERKQQPERLAQKSSGAASNAAAKRGDASEKKVEGQESEKKTDKKSDDKKKSTEKSPGKKSDTKEKTEKSRLDSKHHHHSSSSRNRDRGSRRRPSPPRHRQPIRRQMPLRPIGGRSTRPAPLMGDRIAPPRPERLPLPATPGSQRFGSPRHLPYEGFERKKDDRDELIEKMKRREIEHMNREEKLRLERERERIKFEREKLEREKLELQQLKMTQQALPTLGQFSAPTSLASATRRSFEAEIPVPLAYSTPYSAVDQQQHNDSGRRVSSYSSGGGGHSGHTSRSHDRSRDRSSRREGREYHHSGSGHGRDSSRGHFRSGREREQESDRHSGGFGRSTEQQRNPVIEYGHRSRGDEDRRSLGGAFGSGGKGNERRRSQSPRRSRNEGLRDHP